MPEIDDIIERRSSGTDATGTIVAAIRLLNKGVTRWALRALMKEVEMQGEKKPLMEWALAKYAGEKQCPTIAHLIAPLLEIGMKLTAAYLRSDEDALRQMPSDPAVRRGTHNYSEGA